ncbi:blr5727 [Bradyrhizobium diazoefficiens USDA 110]|uniref:Blr5727 protein n=1 Tax=Bradyrhizobium diazoefficiens (strain JCM 10833 / BCRC 13528 / IAM 13628 / NBRC 14792 / USDA 110) TaxID=224911 RepID=Q89IB2_BRADU|nr:blr5727 [Bradyrhizobium diazoefficiens USDA 110]
MLRPSAANRTIRARFKSRCNVTGERQHASSTLRSFLERWTSLASGIIPTLNHDSRSKKSGYYILYAILDFIVDNYSPVLESIHDEVEGIEDDVLSKPISKAQIERLYMLRRDLLRLRNAIGPLVEVCRRLEHDELAMVRATMQPLFRDVTDHVRNIQERIDSMREVLAFAFEASLLVGQAQETAVSKKLASWLAILAVPTAVAGIYGMNFKYIPELQLEYGYFIVLGLMALACLGLYWRFRRVGWL